MASDKSAAAAASSGSASSNQLPVTFDEVREKNLEQLKLLNSVIFPIRYQERMYQDVLACGLSQYAYHNDVLVGAIACRAEKVAGGKGVVLYILTLGVLAPYRGRGVGTRLLERALAQAAQDPNIAEAQLHVQVSNEEAINFYKRFGFKVRGTVQGYYKRLDPPDAVLLVKDLRTAPAPASA